MPFKKAIFKRRCIFIKTRPELFTRDPVGMAKAMERQHELNARWGHANPVVAHRLSPLARAIDDINRAKIRAARRK